MPHLSMSTTLEDLFDLMDFEEAIKAGYVRIQTHPTLPLSIYNYSEKAVFGKVWTPVTRQCRGLIAHAETGEVLARPFPKFFNHNEEAAPGIALHERVMVTDKVDGSLGILYPTGDGGWAVATRGSFASEQARHATALFQERYAGKFDPEPGFTYLFEIVYPENRIVVDYQGMDDLVLLGAMHIEYGHTVAAKAVPWPGPVVRQFEFATYADALAAEPRPGMEGFVIANSQGERIKLKQEEYVRLHRIVTGLNARAVWESMGEDRTVEEICADLPDEFHTWVRDVAETLRSRAGQLVADAHKTHGKIISGFTDGWTRKDYAMVAKANDLRGYLFRLLDGKDIAEMAWKEVFPEAYWTPSGRVFSEATA